MVVIPWAMVPCESVGLDGVVVPCPGTWRRMAFGANSSWERAVVGGGDRGEEKNWRSGFI
ncbi:hypothetical protein DXU03_02855 [Rhizobium johnstonii]